MIISGKNSVYEAINSNTTINKILISNKIYDATSKEIVKKQEIKVLELNLLIRKF